jgi:hypothetical protein
VTYDPARSDAAVERLGLMDTPPEERFDRITRRAQEMFDVTAAVVNVVDSHTIYTKSQPEGSSFRHTPPQDSFCAETITQDGMLTVEDATADERFAHRGAVTEHGIRFYAGLPLRTTAGETVGTLCLIDTSPRELSEDDREKFEQLGQWAQAEMRNDDVAPVPARVASSPVREDLNGGSVTLASLAIPYGKVSGDRSAWVSVGENIVVTLADVMGKGERAGGLARTLVTALHRRADAPPIEAVRATEEELQAQPSFADTFATLFHAVIDTATGRVDFVDAGHGLNLLLAADGTTTRLYSRNLPLGLRPDGVEWETGTFTVSAGDLIVSVSDGALDAYDSTLHSLQEIADELRSAPEPDTFFDGLSVRVSDHVVDDDVTAVVISIH